MAGFNSDAKSKFDELKNEVAAIKTATDETKTKVSGNEDKLVRLASAVNSIPADLAGSDLFKNAVKGSVEGSNVGAAAEAAKAAAEAAKAAAEATKTAVDNIPRDITLPSDVIQALKEEIRNTVRAEITAQGVDDSAIRTAVAEMRQAVDALRLNAGAFSVDKILGALAEMDARLSRIERNAKLAAFTPDGAKQALNDAYAPFQRAASLPD